MDTPSSENMSTKPLKTSPTDIPMSEPMTPETRIEFQSNMETRLAALGAKIDEFTVTAGQVKEQAACRLDELNAKRADATAKLQELKAQSGEAWVELKDGMEKSVEELKKAWEELRSGSERAAAKFKQ